MARKSVPKKTRFEVFKRDSFACQYCGAKAPDVLLVLDHIQPVSLEGDNDLMNLITACQPCNAGKSDRTLSDASAIKKQQAQLADLNARREQLEMMLKWRDGLKDIAAESLQHICDAWKSAVPGWHLNDTGKLGAQKLLRKHGLQQILDAIDIAREQYVKTGADGKALADSVGLAWSKVGGICALASLPADQRRLYYVKAILIRRLSYVPYDVIDDLKAALQSGCPVEEMERQAKHCSSWSKFQTWLYG